MNLLSKLLRDIVTTLTTSELQVWQKRDRHGYTCWYAYDPMTATHTCFGSEDDMRVWIEQRYYARWERT
jgi:hypothetical protein